MKSGRESKEAENSRSGDRPAEETHTKVTKVTKSRGEAKEFENGF